MPIVFTLLVAADCVSTIMLFSVLKPQLPSTIALVETNPLGYPLCLINILIYPIPTLLVAYGISRVKREMLFWMLTGLLIGVLLPFCHKTLGAVTNNMALYAQLTNQIERR